MKKRNRLLKITTLFTLFALGTSVVCTAIQSKTPTRVEAAQHTDNFASYTYSGNYYSGINFNSGYGLTGSLRQSITNLVFPEDWYTYGNSGETHLSTQCQYADEDPTNSANMIYLYTRDSVKKNAASSWNREHVWPQSLSNGCWGKSKAGTDLLHIRPTYNSTNSSRSNDKFCDVNKASPRTYNGMTFGYGSGEKFEPLDSVKGDVARIIMYVWTAYYTYYGSSLPAITNVFESYDTLLKWHTQDRPDVLEGNRNNYVETSIQKNRNPFVDHPELAWKIFGDSASSSVKSACVQAYPGDGSSGTIDPTSVTLNKTALSLTVGATSTLSATINPTGATGSVTWSSNNTSVATVSSAGKVTAVAAGTATITARVTSSVYSTCTVTVTSSGGGQTLNPLTEIVNLDYTGLTAKGELISAENALSTLGRSNSHISAVEATRIYNGNGSGGAYENTAGMLKTGTKDIAGQIKFTLDGLANKVEIYCHDFYKKSDSYPTNSNTVSVNGSATQLAPYNTSATYGTLTFDLEDTDEITIDIEKRIFVKNIKISYEAPALPSYTVTFNSKGGTSVNSQTIIEGQKAQQPANPTKAPDEGFKYYFYRWCTDYDCTEPYDFDTPVTGNLTLYADYTSEAFTAEDYLSSAESTATIHGTETPISSAETATVTFQSAGLANASNIENIAIGSVTLNSAKGSNSNGNTPKYYSSGYEMRVYAGNTFTFTSDTEITTINLTLSSGSSTDYSATPGTLNGTSWSGSATSVTFTNNGTSQVKIKSISVTYGEESVTVDSVILRFGAKISKANWDIINSKWEITDYGVMLVKETTLENTYKCDSVKEAYESDKTLAIIRKGSGEAPYYDADAQEYIFTVKVNMTAVANYGIVYCAAPFVVVSDDEDNEMYNFLDEMHYSVNTLAQYYLTNGGSTLSNAALEVLSGN